MARAKEDQSHQRLMLANGQGAEVRIVRDDNAALCRGMAQQVQIGGTVQAAFNNINDVEAELPKVGDNIGIEILIRQQREIAQLHPGTSAVTRTSLRTAEAA